MEKMHLFESVLENPDRATSDRFASSAQKGPVPGENKQEIAFWHHGLRDIKMPLCAGSQHHKGQIP
jgi:hypothetical protein